MVHPSTVRGGQPAATADVCTNWAGLPDCYCLPDCVCSLMAAHPLRAGVVLCPRRCGSDACCIVQAVHSGLHLQVARRVHSICGQS